MTLGAALEEAWNAVSARLGSRATREASRLEAAAWDFGGMVRRAPGVLVFPESAEDVSLVLEICGKTGVPVAVRGSGHSQSGQCLSAESVVMDMRRLCRVRVDPAARTVEAEGGATWRSIVDAAFTHRLLPCGLTLVVDTTIAGTLSVAGVGSQSITRGAQIDNVLSLEVATLDGRVVRCSPDENPDLFDAVRGGLGQCGVVLRATYPLRPCKARLRTYFFSYRSAAACIDDLGRLASAPRSELLLGFLGPTTDREWTVLLTLGKEFDVEHELDDAALAEGLGHSAALPSKDTPLWSEDGVPGHPFFRVHAPKTWNDGRAPLLVHPWVDHLFSTEAAVEVLERLISDPPSALRMGTCGLIPVARAARPAPLFAGPPGDGLMIGVGIFPRVPAMLREEAASLMSDYSRRCCEAGGKRYLSGYVDFSTDAAWADHFGAAWPWFHEQKLLHDPRGLLNPGFLTWR